MRHVATLCRTLCVGATLLVGQLTAQKVPAPVQLKPADATFKEHFISLYFGRELSDGRVLMTDPQGGEFLAIDFATNKAEPVSAAPGGPPNFPRAGGIVTLPGDSSMMTIGNIVPPRWFLIEGTKVLREVPSSDPALRASSSIMLGADAKGNFFSPRFPAVDRSGMRINPADSTVILRISRSTGRVDTIGTLRPEPNRSANPYPAYMSYEQVAYGNDGWFGVLRIEPFRVDWLSPDGRWIRGAPLPLYRVPFDAAEKKAYLTSGPGRAASENPAIVISYPEVIPDFSNASRPYLTMDGKMVVMVTSTVANPGNRYFVVNRQGELERVLLLAKNERIMGFGAKSVYVGVRDGDASQIARHPWP